MSQPSPSDIWATAVRVATLRRLALSVLFTIATTSYQTTCTISERTFNKRQHANARYRVESLTLYALQHKLLKNGSIKKLEAPFPKGWTSNIFLVPKKTPGKYRLILNLKKLNQYVTYNKFKMDHIDQVLNMVFPNCFFLSVDLTQAFNHLSMHKDSVPY